MNLKVYTKYLTFSIHQQVWPDNTVYDTVRLAKLSAVKQNIENSLADRFALSANRPNLFNPVATLNYYLPITSQVELSLFDLQGKQVRQLLHGYQSAGQYHMLINGTDLSSGV